MVLDSRSGGECQYYYFKKRGNNGILVRKRAPLSNIMKVFSCSLQTVRKKYIITVLCVFIGDNRVHFLQLYFFYADSVSHFLSKNALIYAVGSTLFSALNNAIFAEININNGGAAKRNTGKIRLKHLVTQLRINM